MEWTHSYETSVNLAYSSTLMEWMYSYETSVNLLYSSTLMERTYTYETSVNSYKATWHYLSEHTTSSEAKKSHKIKNEFNLENPYHHPLPTRMIIETRKVFFLLLLWWD
jgi:hypothetical protein